MINTGNEYKQTYLNKRQFDIKGTIEFSDGTKLDLTKEDFVKNSLTISSGTTTPGNFDIGAFVMTSCAFSLNNYEERFDIYDFVDARVLLYVGLQLSDHVEWLRKGYFIIDESVSQGSIINITGNDYAVFFEREYETSLSYPAKLSEIVLDACIKCGVILKTHTFTNSDYYVENRPDNLTYRDIVAYAAQIAGCFAIFNNAGELELKWYDFDSFDDESYVDGGTFSYDDTVVYSGGTFAYNDGDEVNGGTFADQNNYHHVFYTSTSSVSTDDIVITGIRVEEEINTDEIDSDSEIQYLAGKEGYVLSIKENPLIQSGKAAEVADFLGSKIIGNRFRPLSLQALSDPSMEAGDIGYFTDRRGNTYRFLVTNLMYSCGNFSTITCDAETPAKRASEVVSAKTQVILAAKNMVKKEKSLRELMQQNLEEKILNAEGLRTTLVETADESYIIYLHDKKTLEESQVIIQINREAIVFSTDGGKNYPYGLTVDGKLIVEILSAVGIDADWIRTGIIRSRDGATYWNLDTGIFSMVSAKTGYLALQLRDNGLKIFSWTHEGELDGGVTATSIQSGQHEGKHGISFYCDASTYLALSHTNKNTTGHTVFVRCSLDEELQAYPIELYYSVSLNGYGLRLMGERKYYMRFDQSFGTFIAGGTLGIRLCLVDSSGSVSGGMRVNSDGTTTVYKALEIYGNLNAHGYGILNANNIPTSSNVSSITFVADSSAAAGYYLQFASRGALVAGVTIWTSDARMKENIEISNIKAVDKIKDIMIFDFDYKTGGHRECGVISQQLKEVIPESVIEVEQENGESVMQPDGNVLIPYLIKSIQELSEELAEVKKEKDRLNNRLEVIEERLGISTKTTAKASAASDRVESVPGYITELSKKDLNLTIESDIEPDVDSGIDYVEESTLEPPVMHG